MKKKSFNLSGVMQSKITWAVVAELLILLVCFIIRPDFFSIKYQPATGMLYGSLIDILNRSAEITIIAMGMTLVIALGGTDLSVGSLVALSGALALKFLRWDVLVYNTPGDYTVKPFILVILVPLAVCTLMGMFNGYSDGLRTRHCTDRYQRQTVYNAVFALPCDRAGEPFLPADADYHYCGGGDRCISVRAENRFRHHGGICRYQSQRQPAERY